MGSALPLRLLSPQRQAAVRASLPRTEPSQGWSAEAQAGFPHFWSPRREASLPLSQLSNPDPVQYYSEQIKKPQEGPNHCSSSNLSHFSDVGETRRWDGYHFHRSLLRKDVLRKL